MSKCVQPFDWYCTFVIFRVQNGLAIKMNFHSFDTEEEIDTLSLYEGTGQGKNLTCKYITLLSKHVLISIQQNI